MENEVKKNSNDAKEFAELIQKSREDYNLYRFLSVALQSYTDGLKAVSRCMYLTQMQKQ